MISRTHIILYVANQEASRAFYEAVLAQAPGLDVPGMTEFAIGESVILGLMPESGILRLLNLSFTQLSDQSQIRGELSWWWMIRGHTTNGRYRPGRENSARRRAETGAIRRPTVSIKMDTFWPLPGRARRSKATRL